MTKSTYADGSPSPRIHDEQEAYGLGYDNPSTPWRDLGFGHSVVLHAFLCGQADAQNQAPRAERYERANYHPATYERVLPKVEFKD